MQEAVDPNRESMVKIALALGDLREQVVFIGGSVVGLLIRDQAAPRVRVTKDIDCIIEVASRAEYFGRVRDVLLKRGFRELVGEGAPICAWEFEGIRLDVLPTQESILGFANSWHATAMRFADTVTLGPVWIRVISAPYFIAAKFATFVSRGKDDFVGSHDLEDVVAVIDGRPTIAQDIAGGDAGIREHLSHLATELLANEAFLNSVPGHLVDSGRAEVVLARLRAIADSG